MSTVKISQLPLIPNLNSNTSNTLFAGVDVQTGITGKMTVTTVAQGLYANNVLNVGNNAVVLPNITAQFAGASDNYVQINLQNSKGNGSADMVITADVGTDSTNYIDMGINGSTYNYDGYTYAGPLDGYLVVQGSTAGDPGGNLVIGTTTPEKTISFLAGSIDSSNIVATLNRETLKLVDIPLTFADDSVQNTAAATLAYSQAGFGKANAAFSAQNTTSTLAGNAYAKANGAGSFANGAFTAANTALSQVATALINAATASQQAVASGVYANGAFTTANNALANTSGTTFGGNLNVAGMLSVNNSTFAANTSAVAITGTANGIIQVPAADGYMLHVTGKDGIASKIVVDAFGTGAYPLYTGRQARGNAAFPTATQSGDVIARYSSSSYSSGNTGFLPLGVGRMDFMASENHTDTNRGTQITFYSVNNGSNTLTQTAQFNGNTAAFPGLITANNIVLTGSLTANSLAGQVFFANISVGSSTSNTIQFYPSVGTPTQAPGQLWYNGDVSKLILDTDIAGDRPGVGRTIYERVYNSTGSTIAAGSAVRLQGGITSNNIPYVQLADATTAVNSLVSGYVANPIANGAYGYTYLEGIVENVNTASYSVNDVLFLSTTPGLLSNTAPADHANASIQVVKVVSSNNTTGKVRVNILPRPEYGKANGQVMFANNNIQVASANVVINEPTGTLSVTNGLVQTTRVLSGNQTAFNINFTSDSVVRANISGSNLAITPANFAAGKEVKVWITNIAAGNRTITHGCSAVNATGSGTTYTLPANSTMLLRYMSFGTDVANTYVAATF